MPPKKRGRLQATSESESEYVDEPKPKKKTRARRTKDDEDEYEPPTKSRNKPDKGKGKARFGDDNDEDAPDPGRKGSKRFQQDAVGTVEWQLIKVKKESKKFLDDFQAEADASVQWIEDMLEEYIQKRDEAEAEQAKKIQQILAECLPHTRSSPRQSRTDNEVYKHTQLLLDAGKQTVLAFEQIDEQCRKQSLELPVEQWKQDGQGLKEMLSKGKQFGETLAQAMLMPQPTPIVEPDKGKITDSEAFAIDLFPKSKKALARGDTWGKAAHAQCKALGGLVDVLSGVEAEK